MNKLFTLKSGLIGIILSISILQLNAQVFQKNYTVQGFMPGSHHFTESVIQTNDGNFVFQGWNLADLAFPKMTLLKINQYSNIVWQRAYTRCAQVLMGNCILEDFTASTMGSCVKQTTDGGFIMTGSLNDKMLLMKTNADGSVVTWAKTYGSGSTYGNHVIQTSDGGYICVGYSYDNESTKSAPNVFIVKTTSNGTLSWDRIYRFSPYLDDVATSVAQLTSNDFVVTGYSTQIINPGPNADTTTDIILMKLNSTGTLLWAETYGADNESEDGQSISATSDGGYIVTGNAEIFSGTEPYLWKLNSADVYDFRNVYKIGSLISIGITFGYSSQQTSDGGYALFGVTTNYSLTSITSFSNYMLKLDPNANIEFCKAYKDSVSGMPINLSMGYSIWNDGQQLANGGYLIGGCGIPISGNGLGYKLIKTNTVGESGCSEYAINPLKDVYTPASEPITPPNLSTVSAVANVDMVVKNPSIVEEFLCYEQCRAKPGNDTSICIGGSVQLGGGGPNGETAMYGLPNYSYSWTSNPPGFTSNLDRPVVSPTVTTSYILQIADSDVPTPCTLILIRLLTILPIPLIYSVTATPQTICEGTSSSLTINVDYATSYAWSPATTPPNAQTVTASPTVTTTYTVTATNSCGTATADVAVEVVSSPQINLPPNDTICEGETYTVSGALSNYASITWSSTGTGTFNSTTIPNPTYTPSTADVTAGGVTLSVSVIASSVTCNDSIVEIDLAIMPIPPAPTFNNSLPDLCENAAPYTLTGGTPTGGTYSGTGVTNNIFNPTTAGDGTFTITYTISVFGCQNSSTNTITVTPLPTVSLDTFNNICILDNPIELTGGLPIGGTFSGNGVVNDTLFSPTAAGVGTDTIYYIFTDSVGCSDTAMSTIIVVPAVTLTSDAPGNAVYVELGQVVNFTATPTSAGTYIFAIDSVAQQTSTSNTYATNTLQAGQVVSVILNNACMDTLTINVKPVPNAFIPFDADGSNDIFMPNLDLTIVNRWGQEIYKGTDGWDGKYKGQNASPGTYFYIIKVISLSGEETQFTGTVTLVIK